MRPLWAVLRIGQDGATAGGVGVYGLLRGRMQPRVLEKEVTTHNALSCGEALRANSRPPGPVALGGWRPTAHYSALCRSCRFGCGAGDLWEPHTKRLVPSGAELRRYGKPHCSLRWGRERAEHFGGGQRCGAASFAMRWSWFPRHCRPITFAFSSATIAGHQLPRSTRR